MLDDVFAELDAGRRDRLAELVAPAPSRCWSPPRCAADVPAALAGARFDVAAREVSSCVTDGDDR